MTEMPHEGNASEASTERSLRVRRQPDDQAGPTVVFTTVGINEISPDTIKGKRWVRSLSIEENEPGGRRRTRVRGDAAGLGRRSQGVIMLCKGSTFAATVRRRPKVGGQT
ncbi:hypothetical protein Y032_0003g1578 [Ancylostoma ceylanicum]|uniref:Uncharacterized protein n=1 Tax=Ancylostoma ceylanicum TaxID=53326 RepID=A0A016W0A0_9BILA|nr:hypothetical protein Y032_0003g1578 [Ancylostoma ceylanicum]